MNPMKTIACVTLLAACGEAPPAPDQAPIEAQLKHQRVEALRDLLDAAGVAPLAAPLPASAELFELGQLLFHDKELSGNRDVSCSTCHLDGAGTADELALSIGTGGVGGVGADRALGAGRGYVPRNAPGLYNLHAQQELFWDGRVRVGGDGALVTPAGAAVTADMLAVMSYTGLAGQALFPAGGRPEMRGNVGENELADLPDLPSVWGGLMARLAGIPEYVQRFEAAYPGTAFADMTFAHAANAIAAYEANAYFSADSAFDAFVAGDDGALTTQELDGATLFFGEAGCASCHSGPTLSDDAFHNVGLAQFGPGKGDGPTARDDFGWEKVTKNAAHRYQFRTAPLRNVALTAPYGHVGQYRDLESFVAHYDDPDQSVLDYDVTAEVDDPAHHATLVDNAADVGAALDPALGSDVLHSNDVERIVDFLHALTGAFAATSECDLVPASVPSGLPVDLGPCG
jgi:cytochrome c peroxidase